MQFDNKQTQDLYFSMLEQAQKDNYYQLHSSAKQIFNPNFIDNAIYSLIQTCNQLNFSQSTKEHAVFYLLSILSHQQPDSAITNLYDFVVSSIILSAKLNQSEFNKDIFSMVNSQRYQDIELDILDALNWRIKFETSSEMVFALLNSISLEMDPALQKLLCTIIDFCIVDPDFSCFQRQNLAAGINQLMLANYYPVETLNKLQEKIEATQIFNKQQVNQVEALMIQKIQMANIEIKLNESSQAQEEELKKDNSGFLSEKSVEESEKNQIDSQKSQQQNMSHLFIRLSQLQTSSTIPIQNDLSPIHFKQNQGQDQLNINMQEIIQEKLDDEGEQKDKNECSIEELCDND